MNLIYDGIVTFLSILIEYDILSEIDIQTKLTYKSKISIKLTLVTDEK